MREADGNRIQKNGDCNSSHTGFKEAQNRGSCCFLTWVICVLLWSSQPPPLPKKGLKESDRNSAQEGICDLGSDFRQLTPGDRRSGIIGAQGTACARAALCGYPGMDVSFPGEDMAAQS